jgi:hypothetical protein
MQNWNSLWQSKPVSTSGITALSQVLQQAPPCLVQPATALHAHRLNSSAFRLEWQPGAQVDSQEVLVGGTPTTLPSGALAAPSFRSAGLSAGSSSIDLSLPSDTSTELVRWQVVSRGCGAAQTAAGDVALITVTPTDPE